MKFVLFGLLGSRKVGGHLIFFLQIEEKNIFFKALFPAFWAPRLCAGSLAVSWIGRDPLRSSLPTSLSNSLAVAGVSCSMLLL